MSGMNNGSANVKTGTTGLLLGLLLGVLLPPITWLMAFFLHRKYRGEGNPSDAKGIKIGVIISGILFILAGTALIALVGALSITTADTKEIHRAFQEGVALGHHTTCKSNLKKIATALEKWSRDHEGSYPDQLFELTEGRNNKYLLLIPTCPAADSDTYVYKHINNPEVFTVYCSGKHHENAGCSEDHPLFDSVNGLVEK